jgi:DNA-binding response OmpR family regulator
MKILVAEDDENILNGLCEIFEGEGFKAIKAHNGSEALELYEEDKPDFVCLDIMMPDINGYDVCKKIRKSDINIPVIFISAKTEEIDKVIGLELGADDFITKPFGVHEVVARIRAVARRHMKVSAPEEQDKSFILSDLTVYPQQLKAKRENDEIELSLREVKILQLLYERKNEVVDRDTLLDQCWGEHIMPESRTVDQHIAKLRKRIEIDQQNPLIIKTVHGVGYRYDEA